MRIDKLRMGEAWIKEDDATPQEAKATWDTLEKEFEDNRKMLLASAETDEIIKTINDKFGPGTMFPASEAPIPPMTDQQAIFEWEERNKKAGGGRMKFEKGLLVSDLTETELVNAQSAARKQGITGKKGSKEFADFVGGDTYKRQKTIIKETAEEFGYTYDEYIKLSESEKTKLYNQKYTKASKVKAGNITGDNVEEIIAQLQKGGKFSSKQKEKKMLYDTYSRLFREEFDKLKDFNEPFSRSDLTRAVIRRVEELYTTPDGYFNEDFLPSRQIDNKSWYDFIKPGAKADKKKAIFSDKELKLFSQDSAALRKTKTQEKIFDLLADGVNEVDDIAEALNMPRSGNKSRIGHELDKLLTNMFGRKTDYSPIFLNKERKAKYADVINALENSKSLDGYYRRNIKTVVEETFPGEANAEKRAAAMKKIRAFDTFKKELAEKFPGLEINYDHPASYRALKNQNLKGFLNITPIMKDINTFKSQFDLRSQLNLQAMEEARAAGNMDEYKRLLKNQRGIENLWSNLTGGQSTLGKVRLGKATNLGTTALLDESKDLIKEFEGNLKIRENIAKNLNEDTIKQFKNLFPVSRGETRLIESAKKLTSSELVDFDKKVMAYITDTTGKVKQPMLSSGLAGAYDELLNDPVMKKLLNSRGYKNFADIAKTPGKLFGLGDVAFGFLDFLNNTQKGQDTETATKNAISAMTFGGYQGDERKRIADIKELAVKGGVSPEVFDNITVFNENQNKLVQAITNAKNNWDYYTKIGLTEEANRIQKFGSQIATNFAKNIEDAGKSLRTNLQVQEAGAPIDINVDEQWKQSFENVRSAGIDYRTQQAKEAYDTQKRQVNPGAGEIGNWLLNNIFTLNAREKADLQKQLNDMDEKELYRYNLQRGISPDQPLSGQSTLEFILQNPEIFGSPQSYSNGGIASVKKVDLDEFKEAQEKMKKLMKQYKNKNLDWDAAKRSYRIWTK
jgi:hypothetical protein